MNTTISTLIYLGRYLNLIYSMPQGQPNAHWLKLFTDHPTRFVLGSDAVGRFSSLGETMSGFEPILAALPKDVAEAIAKDNFLQLLPKK